MAKSMKQQDMKNYKKRVRSSYKGNISGAEEEVLSKIRNIEYDISKGYFIAPFRRKMLDDYKKELMVENL